MTAAAFVPTGHPVRRFVASLAVVGVAASILWYSGLAAPRLAVVSATTAVADAAPRRVLVVRLRNDGPLPVEVRRFRAPEVAMAMGAPRSGAVELAGGEAATFEVDFLAGCRPHVERALRQVQVVVRTAAGIERARDLGGLDASDLADRSCASP